MHPEQATHHVFQLDLSDRKAGWQTVAPWPGDARGFAVSCAIQSQDSTCFYLLGGRNYQPDGTLEVLEIQLEGKRPMPAADFLRGIQNKNQENLCFKTMD